MPSGTTLRLSDKLLDLDQPVKVTVNGKDLVPAKVQRTAAAILESLEERADLPAAATALMVLP